MDRYTVRQLERMREESRRLEMQSKALPLFLSITVLPIAAISFWILLPEDHNNIVFCGKLLVAGIIIGLMTCEFLSSSLVQATKYWVSVLCGIFSALPPFIATVVNASVGLTLIQLSLLLGIVTCCTILYLFYRRADTHSNNFSSNFFRACVALLILYAQFQAGIAVARNFPTSFFDQLIICSLYPFFVALFRRLTVFVVPSSGSMISQILSTYFASITYRILMIHYYHTWTTFATILGVEIFYKWIFYIFQLTDRYHVIRKRIVFFVKKGWYKLPSHQRFVNREEEGEDEPLSIPLDSDIESQHKDYSLLFFLQSHADVCIGLGLALAQLVAMKFSPHSEYERFPVFFSDFMSITWKYGLVAVVQFVNMLLFSLFASNALGKKNFNPVEEGTASLASYHISLSFSNVALYFLVFILFYHSH